MPRQYSVRSFLRSACFCFFGHPSPDPLQEEHADENGYIEPPGFHLIPLPFADDIRAAPIEEAFRGRSTLECDFLWPEPNLSNCS